MSDEDVERQEAAKTRRESHARRAQRIVERWEVEGYEPRAHLQHLQHDGDAVLLRRYYDEERAGRVELANWLACHDMHELLSDYHGKTMRERAREAA